MNKLRFLQAGLLSASILASFFCQPANASSLRFRFTGHIISANDPNHHLFGVAVNTTFVGYYTFDSSTPDSNIDPHRSLYTFSSEGDGLAIKMGYYTIWSNPSGLNFSISEANNAPSYDTYNVNAYNLLMTSMSASAPAYYPPTYIGWQLYDSSGTALSSDGLLLKPPHLNQWNLNRFYFDNTNTGTDYHYIATIDSVSLDGDTNGDNCVNDQDLLNIINDFLGTPNVHGKSDITGADGFPDGIVDDSDLLDVINHFLDGC